MIKMAIDIKQFLLIWTLIEIIFVGQYAVASQEYNCSNVKCPSLSKIECPSDSYVRNIQEYHTISTDDNNHIIEEIFINCCITKKCACKLCHRPSCHNTSVVLMETIKETNTPGKCCGEYECILEPNCTEIYDTNGYGWLIDCQRCECLSGQKICHRSCDEIRIPPANCIGQNSKIYSNGQTWKENECTNCECNNGEKKCQTSFCRPLNCINKIRIPGECCPICGPESSIPIEITTANVITVPSSSPSSSTTSTTTTSTSSPCDISSSSSSTTTRDSSETYSVRTDYVEIIQTSKENILYGIIAALCITLAVFIALYCYEKSKQRSYRPVTSFDDNYNKIKIKHADF